MTGRPRTPSSRYRTGWWALVTISGLSILNHISGPFVGLADTDTEGLAFMALAAMNIYALMVLVTAYQRGELWAWWVIWVMIAVYALTILYVPDAGRYYLGGAVVMTVCQFMTWPAFKQPHRTGKRVVGPSEDGRLA